MNNDCLATILLYLDIKDIVRCTLMNRLFNHLINGRLWFELCVRDYPKYYNGLKQDTYRDTYVLCHGLNKLKSISNRTTEIDEIYKGTSIIIDDLSINSNDASRFSVEVDRPINEIKLLKSVIELKNLNHLGVQTWIGDMTNLRKVTLDHNNISNFPKDLCRLTNLEELSIGFNKIGDLPEEIGQLVSLERLYVHHNMLSRLPSEIGKLVNLKRFALEYNRLTELLPEIGDLVSLQYLSFNGNYVAHLPMEILKLKNLGLLSGLSNYIRTVPIEISSMRGLRIYYS